jgi:hypothetical protein
MCISRQALVAEIREKLRQEPESLNELSVDLSTTPEELLRLAGIDGAEGVEMLTELSRQTEQNGQ